MLLTLAAVFDFSSTSPTVPPERVRSYSEDHVPAVQEPSLQLLKHQLGGIPSSDVCQFLQLLMF